MTVLTWCTHVNADGMTDCLTYTRSKSGLCTAHRKQESRRKKVPVNLKKCLTPNCYVQTSSQTGYCAQPGCIEKRGRKVSTEGKAARGQTPDSGSTPDASTEPDNEFLCMQDDMADLRAEVELLNISNAKLMTELDILKDNFQQLLQRQTYSVPSWGGSGWTTSINPRIYSSSDVTQDLRLPPLS